MFTKSGVNGCDAVAPSSQRTARLPRIPGSYARSTWGWTAFSSLTFTTGVGTDGVGPVVVEVSPANGQGGVPVNARVVVRLDEPVTAAELAEAKMEIVAGELRQREQAHHEGEGAQPRAEEAALAEGVGEDGELVGALLERGDLLLIGGEKRPCLIRGRVGCDAGRWRSRRRGAIPI